MNATSASPVNATDSVALAPRLVWDLPQRLVHWLMVLSFTGAYLTAESETWRLVHVSLGYTFGGLLVFRLLWGLIGSRYARFANFVKGPQAVMRYLRSLLSGKPEHHVGHNPAGALAIIAMLSLGLGLVVSGWANYNELGGDWLEEAHELLANGLIAVIAVHVIGVIASSRLHRENLPKSMLTGRKNAAPEQGIRSAWASVAALILVAVLAFWGWQWTQAGSLLPTAVQTQGQHDDDD